MTDLIGKHVRYNDLSLNEPNIEGVVTEQHKGSGWWYVEWDNGAMTIDNGEWLDVIDEDNMGSMIGKQVVHNGKQGVVLEESEDTLLVEFDNYTSYLSKDEVAVVGDVVWQSPQDSLEELQKLCTTNNIHILVSKDDCQIWDEHSDDTYEMDNVDDVMKAIECLNELKKWRQ